MKKGPGACSRAGLGHVMRDASRLTFLGFALGLAQAGDAVAFLPLTAFLEYFEAFEPLEDVAFTAQSRGRAQAAML